MSHIRYEFDPNEAFYRIKAGWEKFAASNKVSKWIVGISGGKDSAVVAGLGARIFGKDNVIGVMMPCGDQKDQDDARALIDFLGIKGVEVNIGKTFEELLDEVTFGALKPLGIDSASQDTRINMPARLRMTTLYAVAQSVGGFVVNTSNLSESIVGFDTLFGDDAGSYAPIQAFTVTEVMALGDWIGLPWNLVHKTPIDGLQPKTDEEKLGVTYKAIDDYIRRGVVTENDRKVIDHLYRSNRFKKEMVRIHGPDIMLLGLYNIVEYYNTPPYPQRID